MNTTLFHPCPHCPQVNLSSLFCSQGANTEIPARVAAATAAIPEGDTAAIPEWDTAVGVPPSARPRPGIASTIPEGDTTAIPEGGTAVGVAPFARPRPGIASMISEGHSAAIPEGVVVSIPEGDTAAIPAGETAVKGLTRSGIASTATLDKQDDPHSGTSFPLPAMEIY